MLAVAGVAPRIAHATHFRSGHITWRQKPPPAPANTVEFTVQNAWRLDGVTAGQYVCVDTAQAGLPTIPCTGPSGNPGVNDVFVEFQGGTLFQFGDNTTMGSPRGPLAYLVTSIDVANNWLFGFALDSNSLPAQDTTIEHTYANSNPRTARIDDGNRISACVAPNAHMNNPDNRYRVETRIDMGSGNSSPVSSLPPIIFCPQNGVCTFPIPVSDNEGDTLSFRLSTATEAQFTTQPGPPQCSTGHAASIDAMTGVYTWDTTGCRLAGDPPPTPPAGGCGNANLNTLYSTQVMIEEPLRGTHTALDFMIQLVPSCSVNAAPVFDAPTPACGSTISANANVPVSFGVHASDANAGDTVALTVASVPAGASLTPSLPLNGNPVGTTFSWTPTSADVGQHVMNFSAVDSCSTQTLCAIIIDVVQEICGDGMDNDGDGLIDCADPDCDATPCDDGQFCTVNDVCQNGGCSGAPRDCSDGNTCTADTCDEGTDTCLHDGAPLDGTPCTDGNLCTSGDVCGGGVCSGTPVTCGDGDPCNGTDTCNPVDGSCQSGPPPACDDGNACNGVETCVPFVGCVPGTPINCDDGNPCSVDTCDPSTGGCHNDGPGLACRQAGRSSLWIRNRTPDRKDKFIWRWGRGDTPLSDLGNPITGTTSFAVCLYDETSPTGSPNLVAMQTFPAGGTCARGKPCWQKIFGGAAVKGYRYKDRPNRGNLRLVLNEGLQSRARMRMIGQGGTLSVPPPNASKILSQDPQIIVQLVSSEGLCWEAKFSPPAKKDGGDEFIDRCSRGRQGTCN